MKNIIVIVCLLMLVSGCGNTNTSTSVKTSKEEDFEKIVTEDNYVVVDVRTKEEYDEGHVVGAVNIPYDEIDESTKLDKNKTIMVYCRSGKRSSIAYETLKRLGYDVFDLGAYDSITLEKE